MESIKVRVRDYLRQLSKEDWLQLKPYGLWNMKAYYRVNINSSFLQTAISFWDPMDNVFRFGSQELCPLFEEFSAILNIPCTRHTAIAVPSFDAGPNHHSLQHLGVSHSVMQSMLSTSAEKPGVRLNVALEVCTSVPSSDKCWAPLMSLLLLSCYLCETDTGICSFRLVSVLPQMAEDASPAALILAETLIHLDSVRSGRLEEVGGSMFLLQVWLMERLCLVAIPKVSFSKYDPRAYLARKIVPTDFNTRPAQQWMTWFESLTDADIRWVSPWWHITDVTVLMRGGVQLLGLTRVTFYSPARLRRQFGQQQSVPDSMPYTSCDVYTSALPDQILTRWDKDRKFETLDYSVPFPIDTDVAYKDWFAAIRVLPLPEERNWETWLRHRQLDG